MAVFGTIDYWRDEVPRTGPANMAVDQLLMEGVGERPLLRVYHWSQPTVSFGYFLRLKDAQQAFPSTDECPLHYVRRWTGGGIVDHRNDLTYTLVIPRGHGLAIERGAESYRVIHQALESVLKELGEDVRLTSVDEGDGGLACFTNPVAYDLTDIAGLKIAGAGQRRSKYGLLHQGSLVTSVAASALGERLGVALAASVSAYVPHDSLFVAAERLASERYSTVEWLNKK